MEADMVDQFLTKWEFYKETRNKAYEKLPRMITIEFPKFGNCPGNE